MQELTLNYQLLSRKYGVTVIADYVANINAEQKKVFLADGQELSYDRLILSPGIDFLWDTLPGYHQDIAKIFPHAWQAGPQTLLLREQIHSMDDGDVALIYVPPEPYRCPPGPYERASLIAYWLQRYKPRSKVLILDAKTSFSKQKLFEAGWVKHFAYGTSKSTIEWISIADNPLQTLDVKKQTLETYFGDKFKAKVLNIIPPQKAGSIAYRTGLTDASGWCPVEPLTGCSIYQDSIHVIGDAASLSPIPKSAFAANSEAKTCALAVVSLLNEQAVPEVHWLNTCYSLITPQHGISVAGVYKLNAAGKIMAVKDAGGVSQLNNDEDPLKEAGYAHHVYRSLISDSFT